MQLTDYCPGSSLEKQFGVSFVLIRFVIGELSEVGGRVGHGLVLAWFELYVLRLVFLDSSLESPRQEKHFGILFIPLHVVVREIVVCRDIVEEIMADLAWFSGVFLLFC